MIGKKSTHTDNAGFLISILLLRCTASAHA